MNKKRIAAYMRASEETVATLFIFVQFLGIAIFLREKILSDYSVWWSLFIGLSSALSIGAFAAAGWYCVIRLLEDESKS